jgi:hypothetical protein
VKKRGEGAARNLVGDVVVDLGAAVDLDEAMGVRP